jgi:hypothetical protein
MTTTANGSGRNVLDDGSGNVIIDGAGKLSIGTRLVADAGGSYYAP